MKTFKVIHQSLQAPSLPLCPQTPVDSKKMEHNVVEYMDEIDCNSVELLTKALKKKG